MRKIAIPTDLSLNAQNAFEYAVSLFNEPSVFYLLHVYAEAVFLPENSNLPTDKLEHKNKLTSQKCQERLTQLIENIKNNYPSSQHEFVTQTKCGYLLDEVNNLVKAENIDLLVMGTRGETNDRNLTFGSNTLQVIKQVQCPVLCIPETYQYKTPKKLLFPTNYMIPYQERELKLVEELSRYYNAEIHMLYVSDFNMSSSRQKDNKAFLEDVIDSESIYFHQVKASSKTHTFNKQIEKMNIDLLVMVNSRHTYLESLLEKSTIDKIGLQPKIPFLILQNFIRTEV
ncbi:universal stress protein [uncultured Planktosalinus sp.]|uniref:universal stress protein n=1 Tax=uncultured Planktosalinus sp. TaxID=1810935 RepID=UPI0030D704D5